MHLETPVYSPKIRDGQKLSPVIDAVGEVPFHELPPTLPGAGVAHEYDPDASDHL